MLVLSFVTFVICSTTLGSAVSSIQETAMNISKFELHILPLDNNTLPNPQGLFELCRSDHGFLDETDFDGLCGGVEKVNIFPGDTNQDHVAFQIMYSSHDPFQLLFLDKCTASISRESQTASLFFTLSSNRLLTVSTSTGEITDCASEYDLNNPKVFETYCLETRKQLANLQDQTSTAIEMYRTQHQNLTMAHDACKADNLKQQTIHASSIVELRQKNDDLEAILREKDTQYSKHVADSETLQTQYSSLQVSFDELKLECTKVKSSSNHNESVLHACQTNADATNLAAKAEALDDCQRKNIQLQAQFERETASCQVDRAELKNLQEECSSLKTINSDLAESAEVQHQEYERLKTDHEALQAQNDKDQMQIETVNTQLRVAREAESEAKKQTEEALKRQTEAETEVRVFSEKIAILQRESETIETYVDTITTCESNLGSLRIQVQTLSGRLENATALEEAAIQEKNKLQDDYAALNTSHDNLLQFRRELELKHSESLTSLDEALKKVEQLKENERTALNAVTEATASEQTCLQKATEDAATAAERQAELQKTLDMRSIEAKNASEELTKLHTENVELHERYVSLGRDNTRLTARLTDLQETLDSAPYSALSWLLGQRFELAIAVAFLCATGVFISCCCCCSTFSGKRAELEKAQRELTNFEQQEQKILTALETRGKEVEVLCQEKQDLELNLTTLLQKYEEQQIEIVDVKLRAEQQLSVEKAKLETKAEAANESLAEVRSSHDDAYEKLQKAAAMEATLRTQLELALKKEQELKKELCDQKEKMKIDMLKHDQHVERSRSELLSVRDANASEQKHHEIEQNKLRSEIRESQKELASTREQLLKERNQLQTNLKKVERLNDEIKTEKFAYNALKSQLDSKHTDLSEMSQNMASAQKKLAVLETQHANLQQKMDVVQAENQDANAKLKEAQFGLKNMNDNNASLQIKIGDLKQKILDTVASKENLEDTLSKTREAAAAAMAEHEGIVNAAKIQEAQLSSNAENLQQKLDVTLDELQSVKHDVTKLREKISEAQDREIEVAKILASKETLIGVLQHNEEKLKHRCETLEKSSADIKSKLDAQRGEIEHLILTQRTMKAEFDSELVRSARKLQKVQTAYDREYELHARDEVELLNYRMQRQTHNITPKQMPSKIPRRKKISGASDQLPHNPKQGSVVRVKSPQSMRQWSSQRSKAAAEQHSNLKQIDFQRTPQVDLRSKAHLSSRKSHRKTRPRSVRRKRGERDDTFTGKVEIGDDNSRILPADSNQRVINHQPMSADYQPANTVTDETIPPTSSEDLHPADTKNNLAAFSGSGKLAVNKDSVSDDTVHVVSNISIKSTALSEPTNGKGSASKRLSYGEKNYQSLGSGSRFKTKLDGSF